jgi:sulfur relay (sulfurtransferase) complex TusBCD TusD component (DsrE family)
MRDPVCSTCGLPSSEVGILCWTENHSYSGKPIAECKRCTAERVMEQESLRAIQEYAEIDAEHFRTCAWCHHRRGLMPKLALFQACAERKRSDEARRCA